jgi:hypothetical protein
MTGCRAARLRASFDADGQQKRRKEELLRRELLEQMDADRQARPTVS